MAGKIQFEIPKMLMDMYKQTERLKSFKDWPFKDDCLCTAEKVTICCLKAQQGDSNHLNRRLKLFSKKNPRESLPWP